MKAAIFVLINLFLVVAGQNIADTFQLINSVRVTIDDSELLSGALLGQEKIYFYTISPIVLYETNLSPFLSSQNISGNIQRFVVDNTGDTATTGVLDTTGGYLYLSGASTIYRIQLSNLSNVTTLVLSDAILPVTSFLSVDSNGEIYANFPSFGSVGNPTLTQVILSKFSLPPSNSTRVYNLQHAANIQDSVYDSISKIAYLTSYNGTVEAVNTDTLTTTLFFNVINYTVEAIGLDSSRQFLYLCGEVDQTVYFVRVNLSALGLNGQNLLINFTNPNMTTTYFSALQIDNSGSICRTMELDIPLGSALLGLFDPVTNTGSLSWINLNTMSIGESNFFIDLMNSKPVAMMLNTNQRYLLLATETQAASFIYPLSCPLNCSGNGVCVYATCNCTPQWMGPTCAEAACSSDCGAPQGRGFCSNGLCVCSSLWTGSNCTERRCPDDCSRNGNCTGPEGNYTCICQEFWTGDNCALPLYATCGDIPTQDVCLRRPTCGWCASAPNNPANQTGVCMEGNAVGPVVGTCSDWHFSAPKEIGLIVVAMIIIVIFALMVLNNVISAIRIDIKTAYLLVDDEEIGSEFLKKSWWRDERSAKSWKLFDQLQFISFYVIANVIFPARLVSFTKFFNWANFALPLPWFYSTREWSNRKPDNTTSNNFIDFHVGRELLNYEQYANSIDLEPEYVFYATLLWFAVALVGFFLLYVVVAFILNLLLSKKTGGTIKRVTVQKGFHVVTRIVLAFYLPLCFTAGYQIAHNFNLGTIGAVVALVIIGLGLPVFNAIVVWGKEKELHFLYLRLRFGALYSPYHYKKARFNLIYLGRKFLVGIMLGFLAVDFPISLGFAAGQIVVVMLLFVVYIVALIIIRPYLDQVHFFLDIALNTLNAVTLGIAFLHLSDPSLAGEIIAVALQAVCILLCIGAYLHSWMMMRGVKNFVAFCSCKKGTQEETKEDEGLKEETPSKSEQPKDTEQQTQQQQSEKGEESSSAGSESSHSTSQEQ